MGLFDSFPLSNAYAVNLDWIMKKIREVEEFVRNYAAVNNVAYAGVWDITKQYPQWAIVTDGETSWLSKQPVPKGIPLENADYWQKLADLDPRIAGIIVQLADVEQNITELQTNITELQTKVSNLKIANVIDYGADPSGESDSSEAFRKATSTNLPIYVPSGHYTIRDNITVGDIYIEGLISGGGLNLTGTLHAPVKKIFDGVSVVDNSNMTEARPEWFDDIVECCETFNNVVLLNRDYTLSRDLTIVKNNFIIHGENGFVTPDYSPKCARIICNNYSITIGLTDELDIGNLPRNITLRDFSIDSHHGAALTVAGCVYSTFKNLTIYCWPGANVGVHLYHNVSAVYDRVRVQLTNGNNFFGFLGEHPKNIAAGVNASVYLTRCTVNNAFTGNSTGVFGFRFTGNYSDVFLDKCETARCGYGISFDSSSVNNNRINDVLVSNAVLDDCLQFAINITDNNNKGCISIANSYLSKGNYNTDACVFLRNCGITLLLTGCQLLVANDSAIGLQAETAANGIATYSMIGNGPSKAGGAISGISTTIVKNGIIE